MDVIYECPLPGAVPGVGTVDRHVVVAEPATALAAPRAPLVLLAGPDRAAVVPAEVDAAPVLACVPECRGDSHQKGEKYANAPHGDLFPKWNIHI